MAVQSQIPGGVYLNETGTLQAQIPGSIYANESQSSGVTISCTVGNATAAGVTATIYQDVNVSCSVGNATANGSTASISNGGTISCTVGNAVAAGSAATITNNPIRIVTEPFINNTETGVLASTAVVWSWLPLGRIGALDSVTAVDGTGTTAADGTLTVTGLSVGAGILAVAVQNTDATDDDVFYYAGTVA